MGYTSEYDLHTRQVLIYIAAKRRPGSLFCEVVLAESSAYVVPSNLPKYTLICRTEQLALIIEISLESVIDG